MNQMSRWYARMLLPADVRRNDQTLHRWNRIPRLFCLMLTRLLSLASQLLETLVRLLDTSGFLTCSSSAAQCEVQGTALLPQERPPSQPANRAMRNWHVRKHPRLPFSLIAFFTSLCHPPTTCHPRLERGSRGSTHQSSPLRHPRPTCSSNAAQGQAQPSSPSSQEFLVSHLESRATQFAVSFFTFFTLFTFFTSAQAETIVSGEVSGVWNTDGSPYIVIDTLFVPEGDTLQIRPGVSVFFHNQTDSTRTPFCVLGSLFIDGEEGDSVCFWSEGAAFQGFYTPDEITTVHIRANYAVFDSLQQLVDIHDAFSLVFRHCRIKTIDNLYQSYNSADTLEYCTIQYPDTAGFPGMTLRGGGPHSICHNKGYFRVQILNAEVDTLSDNDIQGFILVGATPELFARNTIDRLMLYGGTVALDSNHIRVTTTIDLATVTMTHNQLNMVNLTACSVEATNNLLYGDWDIDGGDIFLQNNLCNTNFAIDLYEESTVALINNTFHFRSTCLRLPDGSEVRNNIFMGDGIDCDALHMDAEYDNIQYNIFYNVTGMLDNGETLDETNVEANPFFEGGDPYDYHLQANSPCIDAGDPDSEDDPDGTRADIGCFYYDQSIDNPPVQTIPEEIFAQTGLLLRIQITATDDNGPFSFTFPDLPDWLTEEDELDWVSDTTAVSGTVPEDAEDFSFTVIVEDGEGQTDSSIVEVDVDSRTVLQGEISGILHVEDSPFYVIGDIVVPEGDSLVIEPGCELRFHWYRDSERHLGLYVYGTLLASGTLEDTIRFVSEADTFDWHGNYRGITLFGQGDGDTSRIAYLHGEGAYEFLYAEDHVNLILTHSTLYNNYRAITIDDTSYARIDSCRLIAGVESSSGRFILGSHLSHFDISNSLFYAVDCSFYYSHISMGYNATGIIQYCQFYGGGNIHFDNVTLVNNQIFDLYSYIQSGNGNSGIMANNLVVGGNGCIIGEVDSVFIFNNVFYATTIGIQLYGESNYVTIDNNLFLCDSIAMSIMYGVPEEFHNAKYNCFFGNDSIDPRIILDSTNLFVDPLITDTTDFLLYSDSPLIDAGNPDTRYNDVDGTRNDIGLWGGPYGISYQYPDWVRESYEELPSEFRLSTPYPNPFNSVQHIQVALPCRCSLTLRLYNVLGRQVFTRHTPALDAGNHIVSYSANQLASGMYFLEVTAGDEVRRNRVILLK